MKRSSLIFILALLVVLIGVILTVSGIAIATLSGDILSTIYLLAFQIPGLPLTCEFLGNDLTSILGNVGSGAIIAFSGIIDMVGGWGLWIKRKWAPWLVIIIFSVAAFLRAYNTVRWFQGVIAQMPWSILAMVVDVFIVIYLFRTKS